MTASDQFNIGSDTVISIVSNGVIIASSILVSFNAKQKTALLTSKAITGRNRNLHLEEGWEFDFVYDRADGVWDAYFAAKELARYSGQAAPVIVITETTSNPDGSITSLQHGDVTLKFDDIGDRSGDALVKEKISGVSGYRLPPGTVVPG
jgi:hypothetical protein